MARPKTLTGVWVVVVVVVVGISPVSFVITCVLHIPLGRVLSSLLISLSVLVVGILYNVAHSSASLAKHFDTFVIERPKSTNSYLSILGGRRHIRHCESSAYMTHELAFQLIQWVFGSIYSTREPAEIEGV